MALAPGPVADRPQSSRRRRGQDTQQARGTARSASSSSGNRLTEGPFVAEFIENFCRQSKGEWAGQPIKLTPWQRDLLDDMFELRPDGRRKYRIAYIGMPRKNGKSTLCAALGLYLLVADGEPGAEVYSCAGDRKQASIVFTEARRMAMADPELSELIVARQHHLEVPTNNAVYRVLSADANLQQGLNPSGVVFDEVHVQPNDELWNAMTLGSGTRSQPFIIGITTAGYDEDSLAYRLYDYGKRLERGEITDPTFFFRWWEPPEGADHRDPKTWLSANPALSGKGAFLKREDFETSVRTTPESAFRRFRCNQWWFTETTWLPAGAWIACQSDKQLDPKLPLAVGIDIGLKHDSTAVILAQRQGEDVVVRSTFWVNPYPEGHSLYEDWELDIETVREYLRDLRRHYPQPALKIDDQIVAGPAYCYDPWSFRESAQTLASEGLAMLEVPQNDSRMVPAARALYELITTGRLAHDGDRTLAEHVRNVTALERGDRGWRLTKPRGSRKKIDGAIALSMATWQALQETPQAPGRIFFV